MCGWVGVCVWVRFIEGKMNRKEINWREKKNEEGNEMRKEKARGRILEKAGKKVKKRVCVYFSDYHLHSIFQKTTKDTGSCHR